MPDLTHRVYTKELLDAEDIPFADIEQNMRELNTINTLLGGHAITVSGLQQLIGKKKSLQVCEIGCGGGDNLAALYKYCKQHNIDVHFTGIDLNTNCIAFAKQQYPFLPCTWVVSDYSIVTFPEKPDIIFSSLFCHHFTDPEIISMLRWMQQNAGTGFFINDLQRHPLAWYSIKIITQILSKSYLVKHDAPLSVARSFTHKEWRSLLAEAGILQSATVKWRWAFRYLITFRHA